MSRAKRHHLWNYQLIGIFLIMLPASLFAEVVPIFYPEVKDPYLTILRESIRGIEATINHKVEMRVTTNQLSSEQLQSWAHQQQSPLSVVMGPSSLKALHELADEAHLLSAIYITEPGNIKKVAVAVTYSPDPMILMGTMQRMDKRTRRVHVVINLARWQWLIDIATQAAKRLNMELVVHPASNLSESAKAYHKTLNSMDSVLDSMWLPEDGSTLDTQIVLPMVLKGLWDKNLKSFSSGVSQVGRGALFGFYPDNYAMGQYVGQLTQKMIQNKPIDEPVQPLRQLKSVVNVKAMKHVGLQIDQEYLNSFTMVLPKDGR